MKSWQKTVNHSVALCAVLNDLYIPDDASIGVLTRESKLPRSLTVELTTRVRRTVDQRDTHALVRRCQRRREASRTCADNRQVMPRHDRHPAES